MFVVGAAAIAVESGAVTSRWFTGRFQVGCAGPGTGLPARAGTADTITNAIPARRFIPVPSTRGPKDWA